MRRGFLWAVALAVAAGAADAATMKALYTGVVARSTLTTGAFGIMAGGSLVGMAYELTYLYDPSVGNVVSSPGTITVQGGSATPYPSPMVSAELTINGVTETVTGAHSAFILYQFGDPFCVGCFRLVDHSAIDQNDGGDTYVSRAFGGGFSTNLALVPSSLSTPFSVSAATTGPSSKNGSFSLYKTVNGVVTESAFGSLTFGTLTVSEAVMPPAPIPLPAAFPLLAAALGGLRLLGAARRRAD
jgi:hypothetical protein